MLRSFLVARLHVKEREVGVDELLPGFQLLGSVTLGNRRCIITFAIKRHTQGKLCVEIRRIVGQEATQFRYRLVKLSLAEIEHGLVVLFLNVHCVPKRLTHRRAGVQARGRRVAHLPLL